MKSNTKRLYPLLSSILSIIFLFCSCSGSILSIESTDMIIVHNNKNNKDDIIDNENDIRVLIKLLKATTNLKRNWEGGAPGTPVNKTLEFISKGKRLLLVEKWIEKDSILIHSGEYMFVGINKELSDSLIYD